MTHTTPCAVTPEPWGEYEAQQNWQRYLDELNEERDDVLL